jgi:hypothetical protein
MRYKVVGQNRDTGARMTLEFEAESKAAAERKASQAGMTVHHVADIVNGTEGPGDGGGTNYRGPIRTGSRGVLRIVVLLVILALLAWFFLPQIRGMLHRRARTMRDDVWRATDASAMTMPWTHSPSSGWTTSRSS